MNKKIFNGMLVVAMMFAAVGSFVSCKDHDEEMYSELKEQDGKLKEELQSKIDFLQGQLDALSDAQQECEDSCGRFKQEVLVWQNELEQWKQMVIDNYVTKTEFNTKVAELNDSIFKHTTKIAELKAADVILHNRIDSIKSVVDQAKIDIQRVEDGYKAADVALADSLNRKILAVDAKIDREILSLKNELTGLISTNSQSILALTGRLDKLELTTIPAIVADVDSVFRLAKNDSVRIDKLEQGLSDLKAQHERDNAALVAKIDSICGELDAVKASIADVAAEAAANLATAQELLNARIDSVVTILNNKVDTDVFNTKVSEIEDAYKAADQLLQDQIDDLEESLAAVKKRVKENAVAIKKLMGTVDAIDESLKQFITGILLQATENPVFGSFSYPANIQSNVLMAFYGKTGEYGIEFPSKLPRSYVNEWETLTEKDLEMLGVTPYTEVDGTTIVGNAGKVYVTVNPSNVNFEGQTLPIVNSIEEESGIKLSPLKYSDKKLTFGYSRSAENGLYEADATLAAADVDKVSMKFDFNKSDIKATVEDVLNPLNGVNITNAVNTVADVLGQFNQELDANALKASWTDATGVTRNVYSQYNLATTAVKPLSYSFLKDQAEISKVPGLDRAENFINKMVNKIKVNLPEFNYSIEAPVIEKVELGELSPELLAKFEVVVNIDEPIKIEIGDKIIEGIKGKDDQGYEFTVDPIIVEGGEYIYQFRYTVVVDMREAVEDLYTEMQKPIGDLNTIIDDLGSFMDDVNSMLDEINSLNDYIAKFENAMDRYSDKLISYLDKLNNKVCSLVNSANKALQPVLLVQTNGSFARLSQAINYPSKINGTQFTLVPTSYTAEVIAPAYKKLVGVTNVYSMDRTKNAQDGDANCKAALDAANSGNVAEVLEGDVQKVNFTAKKGYIYEIVYTAVDYHGKVAAKKFYVTAK